ncbi:MAG: LON peptidase substrate-binding domain-containing protein [Ilumatobacteraceae bacterium]
MTAMPMFPLGTPLLPGSILPLHVFEPRYRRLVQDLLAADDEMRFGVVLIERGHEVGGGDRRSEVGTVARVLDASVMPDGRFALATVGTERLRVVEWLPDDPYPLAEVELWADVDAHDPGVDRTLIASLFDRVRRIGEQVRSLGGDPPPVDAEISDDPVLALYHLAAIAPLGPADRQRILTAPGAADRAAVLAEALDDVAAALEFRQA